MLAVAVMVFAYLLVSRLHAASQFVAIDREHNAKVLNQAKQALIGYVAQQAAVAGENNPGHLPCPEAPANFGTANEGIEASFCAAQAIGRLPWRTLGLDKLVDAAGEPLWYAISSGWHRPNSTDTLTINSDSIGQLTVDGSVNNAVALIIAPGPALAAQAGAGCAAWPQTRATTGAPDLRNYLECSNATFPADASFVTAAAGQTFNDQVLRVTTADILPPLEAAIAHRIEREIAPALRGVYASANWGTSAAMPLYPFAAPFTNPGSSNYRGQDGRYQGLLPFTSSDPACGADPRCSQNFVDWSTSPWPTITQISGAGVILFPSCDFSAQYARCWGEYVGGPAEVRMRSRLNNAAMAMRTLDNSRTYFYYWNIWTSSWVQWNGTATATFNNSGQATVDAVGTLPGLPWQTWFYVYVDRGVLADHPLLSASDPTTGWFVRNEWFRLTYYAAAQENTADGLPTLGCTTGTNCLRLNNPGLSQNHRALLLLAGRSINSTSRPSGTLANYLEFGNNDGGTLYEQNPVSKVVNASLKAPFNDRLVIVDSN